MIMIVGDIWGWEHQNSWDLWMFNDVHPLKMLFIGIEWY